MNDLLAVDIVLLPPKDVLDKIISLIKYSSDSPIQLNSHDCLPHISLAMGVLSKTDLKKAKFALSSLADSQKAFSITVTESSTHTTPDGVEMRELLVVRSEELLQLHQEATDAFRLFLSHKDVRTGMFVAPPLVAEISTYWVKHYYDKQGPADYKPHITLGVGTVEKLNTQLHFSAERLALCHLGTYCTCRQILLETVLR